MHVQWGDRQVSASIATRWLDGQLSYKIDLVPDTEYVGAPPAAALVRFYDENGFITVSFTTKLFPAHERSRSETQPLWRKYIRGQSQNLGVTGFTPCPALATRTVDCSRVRYYASRRWKLSLQ
jgi:hypothetical protein